MTDKIKIMLDNLKSGEYRSKRIAIDINTEDYENLEKQVHILREACRAEQPVIFENDSFGFNRYTDFRAPKRKGNVTPNYARIITGGLDEAVENIKRSASETTCKAKKEYADAMLKLIYICIDVAEKYRAYAEKVGNSKLSDALSRVPRKGAKTLYEALVFMKLCIYCLRLYGIEHLTFGRFDQYMYPFYLNDKRNGVSYEQTLETLEEFFISINYDTDLYHGIQQGDNGQSMVLGGFDKDGKSMYNELSALCMKASLELCIIDPKINLRVGKNTPYDIYEYATLLTKQGLGFPQYCNDDVVVPGLVKLGYDVEDAVDYTVAACWEYIIPNCGADIPNLETMDFPGVINRAVISNLCDCKDFESLMDCVTREISKECERLTEAQADTRIPLVPLLSVFFDGCIESLTDIWRGGTKYLNYGCHGAGISNAADALAAIKKTVYEDKTIAKQELLDALAADFNGYAHIRNLLKNSPKMGNNDDYADDIAACIMQTFSENMNNRDNGNGGIWRAGTGSAMEYLFKGEKCTATADGRKAYEPYSSSFSPSLDVKTTGLLSTIQSFTKFDMTNIINGGPLTLEIHDSVLRNDIGIRKTAMLVKSFIMLGGHQLQLNSINRERLKDAQKNPENYPNLIVRVWGWSGYFNELDVKYQNHIIRRCEYTV